MAPGLRSTDAGIDEWARELAPSYELRRWFAHKPERWLEFRRKYREELSSSQKAAYVERIARVAVNSNVTLVISKGSG